MRRFLVSYAGKSKVEGVEYSGGTIHLDDSWVPGDFNDVEEMIQVIGRKGRDAVTITWLDPEKQGEP